MRNLFLQILFITVLSFSYCSLKAQQSIDPTNNQLKTTQFPTNETYKNASLTYSIISAMDNTWGYNILVENELILTQPCIPGMSGNEGFKTKADAESVAKLVIQKMKRGEIPPSVTLEEMKKLNLIK